MSYVTAFKISATGGCVMAAAVFCKSDSAMSPRTSNHRARNLTCWLLTSRSYPPDSTSIFSHQSEELCSCIINTSPNMTVRSRVAPLRLLNRKLLPFFGTLILFYNKADKVHLYFLANQFWRKNHYRLQVQGATFDSKRSILRRNPNRFYPP